MFKSKWDKKQNMEQSIKYVSNSLIRILSNEGSTVIGVTSSLECSKQKFNICKKICKEVQDKDKKIIFVDIDDSGAGKNTEALDKVQKQRLSVSKLRNLIDGKISVCDFILVNIPCVTTMADSVEYAKVCGRVILLERYLYSKYKDYEEAIIRLRAYGVKIDGVVTYG